VASTPLQERQQSRDIGSVGKFHDITLATEKILQNTET
jgi:hypothetical protein